MEANEVDTLPLTDELESQEMPEIVCVRCGEEHALTNQGIFWGGGRKPFSTIRGTLVCGAPRSASSARPSACGGKTLFELTNNAISWAPGNLFNENLKGVSQTVTGLFLEAINAFYGDAHKGVLALCRSTVKQSLDEKNVPGKDLYEKVQNAPASILGSQEKTWADASRLDGRDALHRLKVVTPTESLISLNTTIQLANHIAGTTALPATKSGISSNEQ